YGKVTARIKTASIAKGVVSSFIIRNDQTGDEIDFEFVGLSPNQVQTNYYFNNVLDYTKMVPYELGASTAADFHDYTIDWSKDAIVWSVDGKVIRTVKKADTFDAKKNVYAFPTSEARVALSIWDGGNAAGEGTRQWAGFPTPFDGNKVYEMYVDSVKIECNGDSTAPQSSATASVYPTSSDVYSASSAAPAPGQTSVHKCIPRPSAY
ncbi:putative glycosidase CRH2, partial [Dipsacomyces acuminosporus]